MFSLPLQTTSLPRSDDFTSTNDRNLEHLLSSTPPSDDTMSLSRDSKLSVFSSAELPSTPPKTPQASAPASPTLDAILDHTIPAVDEVVGPSDMVTEEDFEKLLETLKSTDPLSALACIYCCPTRACPGGSGATCFKMATTLGEMPTTAGAYVTFQEAEMVECEKVKDCFRSYVAKINQHNPFGEVLMTSERIKAAQSLEQLDIVKDRLAELVRVVKGMEGDEVSEMLVAEAEKVRGWVHHLWGKMVKNHEYLKLNYYLTFTGTY